jgi:ligand-binding SRPBCC domain-containing protein
MSKVYRFKTVQKIPVTLGEAWAFFSNPANLSAITPPQMDFQIVSLFHGGKMHPGQIIEYQVKPVAGISMYWMTEITHVEEEKYFVDEQRFGPYSLWHHQHHFLAVPGGVEMTDIVHYKIPFGLLGDLGNYLFVKRELKKIFQFRFHAVEKRFGRFPNS